MTESEKIIEFDKIKEKWANHALTVWAKQQIAEITPFLSEAELRKNMRDTTEGRQLI